MAWQFFPDITNLLGVVGGILLTWIAVWKGVFPLIRFAKMCFARLGRALDVLIGVDAIPDPDHPGEILRPAIPDIGVRVTSIEDKLDVTVVKHVERAEAASLRSQFASEAAQSAAEDAARDSSLALTAVDELRVKVEELQEITTGRRAEDAPLPVIDDER
jgi:hypothetical protein